MRTKPLWTGRWEEEEDCGEEGETAEEKWEYRKVVRSEGEGRSDEMQNAK